MEQYNSWVEKNINHHYIVRNYWREAIARMNQYFELVEYSGHINVENMDAVISYALAIDWMATHQIDCAPLTLYRYSLDYVNECLEKYFGETIDDFSSSKLLDPVSRQYINTYIDPGAEPEYMTYGDMTWSKQGESGTLIVAQAYGRSIFLDNEGIIRGYRSYEKTSGPKIQKLADGNEWYLINGYVQHTFTGSVEVDGMVYDVIDGMVNDSSNEIVSIAGKTLSFVEYTHGEGMSYLNDQGEWEHNWSYTNLTPEIITITYSDGTQFSGTQREIEDLTGRFIYYEIQYPDSIGVYHCSLSLRDRETQKDVITGTFDIEVLDSGIESIEVEDMNVLAGTHGVLFGESLEGPYFFRFMFQPEMLVFHYKDGTSKRVSYAVWRQATGGYISDSEFDSREGYLEEAHYQCSCWVQGHYCEYNVNVAETPIDRVELIKAIQPPFSPMWTPISVIGKVYLKDGTVYEGELEDFAKQYHTTLHTYGVGIKNLMGVPLELNADNLEKISVKSFEILEDIVMVSGAWFDEANLMIHVEYSDGQEYTGPFAGATYDLGPMYNLSLTDTNLPIGKYDATIQIAASDQTYPCTVSIIEDPIASIEFDSVWLKEDNLNRLPDCSGYVNYKDGTRSYFSWNMSYGNSYWACIEDPNLSTSEWKAGNTYPVNWSILGNTYTQEMNILPSIEQITISGEENLTLHITLGDGSQKTLEALSFRGGTLVTEEYIFSNVAVLANGQQWIRGWNFIDDLENVSLVINGMETNALQRNAWLNREMSITYYLGVLNTGAGTGKVDSAELSIDDMVEYAAYYLGGDTRYGEHEVVFDRASIEKAVKTIFGIAYADLTTSQYYDEMSESFRVCLRERNPYSSREYYQVASSDEFLVVSWKYLVGNVISLQSICLDENGHLKNFTQTGYSGERILPLADGNLWYAINGIVQEDFRGNVEIEGEIYQIENGRVVDETYPEGAGIVQGCSLTLNGDIGLNFYLNLDANLVTEGAYVVFERNGIISDPVLLSSALHQGRRYKLTYHVSAKEMDDTIILKLYDGEGNLITLYKDEDTYENGYPYSVNTYVELALSNNSVSDELKDLMRAMRQYGDCAQGYFGYSDAEVSSVAVDPSVFKAYTFSGAMNSSTISYYGSSLLLKDLTTIRHYFTFTDGMENYSVTVNGTTASLVQKGSLCYVEIADIAAQDLEEMPVVVITDQNDQVVYRLVYGAFSYADVVMNQSNNDQLKTLMAALYLYWQSAEAYFAK